MTRLKEILRHEVYPALGCTEPIACAFAASVASSHLGAPVESVLLRTDHGTFKNGRSVVVPHTGGMKGNRIAAALGAILACPEADLQLLERVTPNILERAATLIHRGQCEAAVLPGARAFMVEATVRGGGSAVRCVLAEGHTNVILIEKDGVPLELSRTESGAAAEGEAPEGGPIAYRGELRAADLSRLVDMAESIDAADRRFLRRGVQMNLRLAEMGVSCQRTAYQLQRMRERGYLADDLFFRVKSTVAAAVDARMTGCELAAMTSGGSGNQGIIAVLTPYLVGTELGVDEESIDRAVALSHLFNAYVKCYLGELSVICGCAVAAGAAAAVAIVYLQSGKDLRRMALAVNNVIGDLSGLICDGAKPGCAMKAVSAVDASLRAALMALDDYGLDDEDGLVGQTPEDSIRNLGRLALEGMFQVDPTVLSILEKKSVLHGRG